MEAVAFDHKTHEENGRPLLHLSSRIHGDPAENAIRTGSEKSKYTRLETAMQSGSMTSCLGCHETRMTDKNCAGCTMPR
ncbi:MAG: hypothetical protein R2861_10755 [Desulfobacterales bacterium]